MGKKKSWAFTGVFAQYFSVHYTLLYKILKCTELGCCNETLHYTEQMNKYMYIYIYIYTCMWHMTCDVWHMTHDRWGEVSFPITFQLPSSYGLGVKGFCVYSSPCLFLSILITLSPVLTAYEVLVNFFWILSFIFLPPVAFFLLPPLSPVLPMP